MMRSMPLANNEMYACSISVQEVKLEDQEMDQNLWIVTPSISVRPTLPPAGTSETESNSRKLDVSNAPMKQVAHEQFGPRNQS